MPGFVLKPIAQPIVTLLTMAMSNSFQERVIRDVRQLYLLREANSVIGTPKYRMLAIARRQLDAVYDAMTSRRQIIPAFLVGGAALSALASILDSLLHDAFGRYVLFAAILLLTAFWCLITAAAITRRRTSLILDQSLKILWQAVGGAGRPPREPSRSSSLSQPCSSSSAGY